MAGKIAWQWVSYHDGVDVFMCFSSFFASWKITLTTKFILPFSLASFQIIFI